MKASLRDLVDAGAVRMLCMYQMHVAKGDPNWLETFDFARREFRRASKTTIRRLILVCRKSSEGVKHLSFDVGKTGKPIVKRRPHAGKRKAR